MKKIILSTFFTLYAISSFAQREYRVADLEDNPYEDNNTFVFDVHGSFADPAEAAKLHLLISNESSSDIYLRGQIIEMINTNGELAQFCIGGPSGNCFFPLYEGSYYPNQNGGILYANSNWGMFDYFINLDETNLAEYKVRFTQTDGEGNEIEGTDFTFSYLYNKDGLGVNDIRSQAIAEVYPTVAKGFTNVNLKENANIQILNTEGRIVKVTQLKSGASQLDLTGLSSGVYWVNFKGDSGITHTIRIVVK
ncbi:MAG: T9SS type A sorting domain-containing protein [Weeksellaceae bacterium]|jgi:hypothetical protein|nr:T9SS type A sorting domain-containing protein [Weeksellaceae bacterium]MDX9704228.1 T9SS type A sorting domain-containing protein [Weeksellaceae bacterium]